MWTVFGIIVVLCITNLVRCQDVVENNEISSDTPINDSLAEFDKAHENNFAGPAIPLYYSTGLWNFRALDGESPLEAANRACQMLILTTLECNRVRAYYFDILEQNGYHLSLNVTKQPQWPLEYFPKQHEEFVGVQFRLPSNWLPFVPLFTMATRPITYLEVGTFHGANMLSIAISYAAHPSSQIHCVDPWAVYDDYDEYKTSIGDAYTSFIRNVGRLDSPDKVHIHRGYSSDEIPKFRDQFFDVIYIDGNHEPEYVLQDAVLSFFKLKIGGYMIFDDYGWGGPGMTMQGIDAFLSGFHKRISVLGIRNLQVFVQRTS